MTVAGGGFGLVAWTLRHEVRFRYRHRYNLTGYTFPSITISPTVFLTKISILIPKPTLSNYLRDSVGDRGR
ncbi:hypothetical protein CMV_000067 [Castanea mollissima]|uniref:Uncharacterized protein n=1 Tax=Castanea mollissima TaxID=60419 RepID=A0A8J4RZL9_9ROSI|nr:hypothetical protein CMV_000067 [Castanea mollissima]